MTALMRSRAAPSLSIASRVASSTPPAAPFVDDKETSGILEVTDLFRDAVWYRPGARVLLVVVQAHFNYDLTHPIGADLVEGGQLLLLVRDA